MTSSRKVVVAIDGPAGAGKSTVTRALTRAVGYQLLDTGALYRSVALAASRAEVALDDGPRLAELAAALPIRFELSGDVNRVFLGEDDVSAAIRTPEMSEGASLVSALPAVRAALLDLQRDIGRGGGVVAEGRDIGTVVFPGAAVKFFLTATVAERARRRLAELQARGETTDLATVKAEIEQRDRRDSSRDVAPLKQAADAILVDSTGRSVDEIVGEMVVAVRRAEAGAG